MNRRKVALFTVGCKLNQYETEWMGESLENIGFKRVDFSAQADLYIINTCTVTAQSDYSSRQAIYRAFRKSPGSKIVVAGCYSEIEPELLRKLPGVCLLLGNEDKKKIGEIVLEKLYNEKTKPEAQKKGVFSRFKHTRALVKVQDGCDQSCAYCIVPSARGSEWSRDAGEVIEEIKGLRDRGFKEVVLTGVHIGKYSQNKFKLAGLLEKILSETEIERLRLSSVEPKELDKEIIKLLSEEKRLCRHLHIPLQSGSDEILQRMKRNYSVGEYYTLISKIQKEIEDVTLGADVMVGFPGEKEEDFEKTCELIWSSPLAYLHVFSYSDRRGTLASRMPDKISPQTVKIRSKILHQVGKEKWEKHLDSYMGKQMEILVENSRDKNTGKLVGLTGNYLRVLIAGNEDVKNKILKAKIVKREGKYLVGEIVNE